VVASFFDIGVGGRMEGRVGDGVRKKKGVGGISFFGGRGGISPFLFFSFFLWRSRVVFWYERPVERVPSLLGTKEYFYSFLFGPISPEWWFFRPGDDSRRGVYRRVGVFSLSFFHHRNYKKTSHHARASV